MLPLWDSVLGITVASSTVLLGSALPPLQPPPVALMTPVSQLKIYMTCNPTLYDTMVFSRHQHLVRRLLVSTAPSLRSWAQLFLSLITETSTSLSGIISLPLTLPLWNFRFFLVFRSPATTILSKTKPVSVQQMPSAILSSFYGTLSGKNSWWMDSQLNKRAPSYSAGENRTMVTTVPTKKGNHRRITNTIAYQSYCRPSSLTVTPLKDHHKLYHTTAGTLTIHNRDC